MRIPLESPIQGGGGTIQQASDQARSAPSSRRARRHAAWASSAAARFGLRNHVFRELMRLSQEPAAGPDDD